MIWGLIWYRGRILGSESEYISYPRGVNVERLTARMEMTFPSVAAMQKHPAEGVPRELPVMLSKPAFSAVGLLALFS